MGFRSPGFRVYRVLGCRVLGFKGLGLGLRLT